MAKTIMLDELHVTIRVPAHLADEETESIRVTLMRREFMARMRVAIRGVIQGFPELTRCRVTLSR